MAEEQIAGTESTANNVQTSRRPLVLYGVSFGLLGLCVGLFAGLSHSPVIGVLLPLLFGLIGGANGLYLARADLTNEQDRKRLGLLGLMLSVFLILVLAGSFYGMLVRTGGGLSALLPHSQPVGDSTTRKVALADIDTLDAGTALELALLRYRLSRLGVGATEQKTILAAAREAIQPSLDREQMAAVFRNLFTLADQIGTLLSEQDVEKKDAPSQPEEILRFVRVKMSQYGYLIQHLPQHDVPISHLVDLIERNRKDFSSLIRERRWQKRDEPSRFTQWLLDNPGIRNKLWELELAYADTAYRMRDLGWLSGQPLAKTIDGLIQSTGSSASATDGNSIVSEARRRTGFAP